MDEAVTGNQYAFGAVPLKVGVVSCGNVVKNEFHFGGRGAVLSPKEG